MQAGQPQHTDRDSGPRSGSARLDPETRVPLYQQIVVILQNRILGGELAPGDLLPGEQELSAEFGVSRITAKRALNELADAGLVKRERGRGTRVLERPGPRAVRASIEGWLENVGHMQRVTRVEVLEFAYVAAPPEIALALALEPGAPVQRAVRVRSLDGAAMSYLVSYVPEAVGRTYDAEDLAGAALLKLLERAGIAVASARQTVSATLAAPDVAQALGVHAGAPLIEVRRIVEDGAGRPVEYIRVLYRPDLYRIEMTMQRVAVDGGMIWSADDAAATDAGEGR